MGTQCRTVDTSKKMAIFIKNTMKKALLNKIKNDDVPISIILGKISLILCSKVISQIYEIAIMSKKGETLLVLHLLLFHLFDHDYSIQSQ